MTLAAIWDAHVKGMGWAGCGYFSCSSHSPTYFACALLRENQATPPEAQHRYMTSDMKEDPCKGHSMSVTSEAKGVKPCDTSNYSNICCHPFYYMQCLMWHACGNSISFIPGGLHVIIFENWKWHSTVCGYFTYSVYKLIFWHTVCLHLKAQLWTVRIPVWPKDHFKICPRAMWIMAQNNTHPTFTLIWWETLCLYMHEDTVYSCYSV